MAGRTNKGRGGGGRGDNKPNGSGRGRGGHRSIRPTKTGLCKELEGNIFDFGERSSADLMRTTYNKIAHHVGIKYGGDIMKELETKTAFIVPPAIYPASATARQPAWDAKVLLKQNNRLDILRRKKLRLQAEIRVIPPPTNLNVLEEEILEIDDEIIDIEYDKSNPGKVPLDEGEKGEWRSSEKNYGERVANLNLNRQKAFAVIIGQCTQRLQDKMHDDPLWETVNTDQKPLELYALIERVVMKQSGDEYQATNIVENLLAVLTMKQQNNMSNPQWYEKLNTRVDVAESVGVKFDIFRCMWEYCIEKKGWADYDNLTAADQATIRNEAKERLLAYLLIRNSSSTTTHDLIRNNLVDAFLAKRDEYLWSQTSCLFPSVRYREQRRLVICTRALVIRHPKISNGFCNRIRSRTAQLRRRMPS